LVLSFTRTVPVSCAGNTSWLAFDQCQYYYESKGLFQLSKQGYAVLCKMWSLQQPGQNGEGLPEVLQDTWQHPAKTRDVLECLQWQQLSVLRQH